jgi:hypothetical protein
MKYLTADRPAISIVAAVLGVALMGATLLSSAVPNVVYAQAEPVTAANGVLLPPADFDPAGARSEGSTESAVAAATPTAPVSSADESTASDASETTTDTPEGTTDAPTGGSSTTTVLGGSDVAVSSVGGSYEVDRPNKRSERKR